jgi:hypothetical protein
MAMLCLKDKYESMSMLIWHDRWAICCQGKVRLGSPMTAPATWAMNIDLGLLMVICPVLKSCSRRGQVRHNTRCSTHSTEEGHRLHSLQSSSLCSRECTGRVQHPSFPQESTDQGRHLKSDIIGDSRITCISVPADDVAAMTNPATARPAMTPPSAPVAHTANTKIAICTSPHAAELHVAECMQSQQGASIVPPDIRHKVHSNLHKISCS